MPKLVNKDTWYMIEWSGTNHYNSNVPASVEWANEIQARWTDLNDTVYTIEYRCVLRKYSGGATSNTSDDNAYSIGGDSVPTVSDSGTTISFPISYGVNPIATTVGTHDVKNGNQLICRGGVMLAYGGQTWGKTNLAGTVVLPAIAPVVPTVSVVPTSSTSVAVTYGTPSFQTGNSGTVYLYGGSSASPTTQIESKHTTGDSTVTIENLTPGATYYYRARAAIFLTISAGGTIYSDYSTDVVVTLPLTDISDNRFYGSVDSKAAPVARMLGSTSGQAVRVTKLYGPSNGVAKRIL